MLMYLTSYNKGYAKQFDMKNKNNDKKNSKNNSLNQEQDKPHQDTHVKKVVEIPLSGVITACATIICGIYILLNDLGDIKNNIIILNSGLVRVDENIISINKELEDIHKEINSINAYLYNDGGVQDQLRDINERLKITPINIPNQEEYNNVKTTVKENDTHYGEHEIKYNIVYNSYLGFDINGNICIAKDYINKPLLLTYKENDKEVYFYGKYNEKYHWNGFCVTNTYNSDGSLFSICESNFDDGKRLDYKSFYCDNESEWIYSNKDCSDTGNVGINITYKFNYSNIKNFTNTNVRISDIIYVDDFIKKENPIMLKYYFGNTSDIKYNDDTGEAYEIKYDEDGTIKTLYVGKFVNGNFEDSSGNAWDIAYSDQYRFYVHNTGNFTENHAIDGSSDPIGINEIENILSDNGFNCGFELNWKHTKYDKEQEK